MVHENLVIIYIKSIYLRLFTHLVGSELLKKINFKLAKPQY